MLTGFKMLGLTGIPWFRMAINRLFEKIAPEAIWVVNVLYLNSTLSSRLSYLWDVKAYAAKYKPINHTHPVGNESLSLPG